VLPREGVAEAALGDDHARVLGVVFDLLAEVPDVELHLVAVADVVAAPDVAEDLVVREHPAAAVDEVREELVLRAGEGNVLSVYKDFAAAEVNGEAVALVDPAALVSVQSSGLDRLQAQGQLLGLERLHVEAPHAQFQGRVRRLRCSPRSRGDDDRGVVLG